MGCEHQTMLRGRQREEPLGDRRRNGSPEQLLDARRLRELDPFRTRVNLDDEREVLPLQWAQVVDVAVERGITGRLESSREQRCLCFFGVCDQKIDIAEEPECRIQIARCDLRAFVEDRGAVIGRPNSLQQSGHAQSHHRRRAFELRDVGWYLSPEETPPPRREELEPMTPQVGERGRVVDETVDRGPQVTRRLPETHAAIVPAVIALAEELAGSSRSASPRSAPVRAVMRRSKRRSETLAGRAVAARNADSDDSLEPLAKDRCQLSEPPQVEDGEITEHRRSGDGGCGQNDPPRNLDGHHPDT